MRTLEFWYDLASTYSFLSAMRIEELAERAGVGLLWRPFLLGPIFKAQGLNSTPFNIYPAKGRYMLRDIGRTCAERGLAFKMPAQFPASSLLAVRLAHAGEAAGWTGAFSRAVFEAELSRGDDIADRAVLGDLLSQSGVDPAAAFALAESESNKSSLKARTEQAVTLGIFGAPTFVTRDGELFWGDDRLEQALRWACRTSS